MLFAKSALVYRSVNDGEDKWESVGKYKVKRTMDKVQNSARAARLINDG